MFLERKKNFATKFPHLNSDRQLRNETITHKDGNLSLNNINLSSIRLKRNPQQKELAKLSEVLVEIKI